MTNTACVAVLLTCAS